MSGVPHEASASDGPAGAAVGAPRVARANGWWGMAVFLAGEVTLFGVLIGSYVYLRLTSAAWPPAGIDEPDTVVPLVVTAVLVASSIPMQLASRATQRGLARTAWWWIFAALVVQTGYFAMEVSRFDSDLASFTPQGSAYGSIYYTLLGAHHIHVFVGLLMDLWLLARLGTGLTGYRVVGVQAAAFYWHVVNALAVLVTVTILSAAL